MKNTDIVKNTLGASFGLAGIGVGLGIVGNAFDNESISSAGSISTGFISPAINIGMGALTINMLKQLKR
jgi:hypothetical protein